MTIFDIAALPAAEGDCLVLSYGVVGALQHIVIDGGRKATAPKLRDCLRDRGIKRLELLVVTHVDADHIEGIIDFLDEHEDLQIDDVWFNGFRHLLADLEGMGPVQGDLLTTRLLKRNWNQAFGGGPVRVADNGEPLVLAPLAGGLKISILSPDRAKLKKMHGVWERDITRNGLVPMVPADPETVQPGLQPMGAQSLNDMANQITKTDGAEANGASIAFVAEYAGKSVLFAADAHADLLTRSIELLGGGAPLPLDLFKVPHHGSQANVTEDLMAALRCSHFLISTSGARFKHPDAVAVARMIVGSDGPARLGFNYVQDKSIYWRDRVPKADDPAYSCHFVDEGEPLVISLGSEI